MKHIKQMTLLTLGLVLLGGCAKEKEYDDVYKPDVESLSKFPCAKNLKDAPEMLYVPMTLGTPREVADANPFYQGGEKVVKCVFTEEGIEVVEIEKDERFSDNDLNNTPVLMIPGKYKEYGCKEDQYGDCTNVEEEKSELEWFEKKNFEADYAGLEVKEVNMLDLVNVEGSSCVKPQGVKMIRTEKSKDGVLNIELEKTYKLSKSWRCIRNNYFQDKFSYNSFKVRFFYSMVSLDKLATKGYEPVSYPIANHSKFGFFKSKVSKLNSDFDTQRQDVEYLINRWDPKKKVIDYYLSKSFNKKENRPLLDATMNSMEVMNKSLEKAGLNFKINFIKQDDSQNISPGDLRYNSIVLIDDPLANGLLGYAPTVKNPKTGEIVQGHVNMYGGVLTSGTRWVYEGAVDIMEEQILKLGSKTIDVSYDSTIFEGSNVPTVLRNYPAHVGTPSASDVTNVPSAAFVADLEVRDLENLFSAHRTQISSSKKLDNAKIHAQEQFKRSFDNKAYFDKVMSRNFEGMNEIDKRVALQQADELGYKLHTKHAPEFFPIAGTKKVIYPGLLKIKDIKDKRGILKRWNKLTNAQKEKVKEVILVNRYTATFVHEMGHSLGLRHNFAGSTDAANFYSLEEAKELKMNGVPAYSSVMDYAVSEFNELGAFGKYDVAALRYGYTGTLAAKDGTVFKTDYSSNLNLVLEQHNQSVKDEVLKQARAAGVPEVDYEETIKILKDVLADPKTSNEVKAFIKQLLELDTKSIADYKFCTDENAGLSATCNRFDEGTNLLEIAKFRTQRYKDIYKYRNFRDGRLRFKSTDLDWYAISRYREFGKIRDIMELYDLYSKFVGQDVVTKVESCDESEVATDIVCELNESLKTVANMFLDILKTPDLTCAVGEAGDEQNAPKVKRLVKMTEIMEERSVSSELRKNNHFLESCFDPMVKDYFKKENLVVIGEVGKFLNSHRDSNPNYKYADDIYVRGIWVDKMMAMKFLFERRHQIGTTDETQLALIDHPTVKKEFLNIMKHMIMGKKLENPLPFLTENGEKFYMPYIIEADTKINQVEDDLFWLKMYFKMEQTGEGNLLESMLAQIWNANIGVQGDALAKQYQTQNYVSTRKWKGYFPEHNRNPNLLYFYDEGNGERSEMTYAASKTNAIAFEILTLINKMDELKAIPKESFNKIISHKIKPKAPAGYDEADSGFFDLSLNQQQVVISLIDKPSIPLEAFENFAGNKEIAAKMFAAYTKMHKVGSVKFLEKIIKQKEKIVAHGPLDATDNEKKLLNYELDFLQDFSEGKFTQEVVDFYIKLLSKMPLHVNK